MGKPSHQHYEIPICCILILFKGLLFHAASLLWLALGSWDVGTHTNMALGWGFRWMSLWDSVKLGKFESSQMAHSEQKKLWKGESPLRVSVWSNNVFIAQLLDHEERLTETMKCNC